MHRLILLAFLVLWLPLSAYAAEGMTTLKSDYSVTKTADRFEALIHKKGLTLFSRINHQKNAEDVSLSIKATEVIVFGNPKVGTRLMQCSPTVAIDLPQKVLVWEDKKGKVWLSYNNPHYLKKRHNIQGCDEVIEKIAAVSDRLTKTVAKDSHI